MIHRLLTFASVLSLVLCSLICGLWVSSRVGSHEFVRASWKENQSTDTPALLVTRVGWDGDGVFVRQAESGYFGDPRFVHAVRQELERMSRPNQLVSGWDIPIGDPYSVVAYQSEGGKLESGRSHDASYPRAVATLLLLPVCWAASRAWARFRSWRIDARSGVCHTCGYDLRASENRCPECGTPISSERKATV